MPGSDRSASSFGSSVASSRFSVSKITKFQLKKRFYEKLDDFKNRVMLHHEEGMAVFRARCVYSGAVVVLKGYSRESLTPQTKERIWNEVQTLQNSQCPFILKCFDAFEDRGWWWLVLENCAAGDLFNVINVSGSITEEGWLVTQVLLPLLQTLNYLHTEGIIHRDVKPENLMFNSEKVTKLSGFLLSTDITRSGYPKDLVGTLDYVAPEVIMLNNPDAKSDAKLQEFYPELGSLRCYDQKVDIWQVGILTFDVLVGHAPFESDAPEDTVSNILFSEPDYPDWLSADAVSFMSTALRKHAEDRPTARQLLSHPWVRTHLNWEPPEEFTDPIPVIDYRYYQEEEDGEGEDMDDNSMDDWKLSRPLWYNPMTWGVFKRKRADPDQDLTHAAAPAAGAAARKDGAHGSARDHVITVQGGAAAGTAKQQGPHGLAAWLPWNRGGGGAAAAATAAGQRGGGADAAARAADAAAAAHNKVAPLDVRARPTRHVPGVGRAGSGFEMEDSPVGSSEPTSSFQGVASVHKVAEAAKGGLKEVPVHRISDDGMVAVRPPSRLAGGTTGSTNAAGTTVLSVGTSGSGAAAVPALQLGLVRSSFEANDLQLESARSDHNGHEPALSTHPSRLTSASAAVAVAAANRTSPSALPPPAAQPQPTQPPQPPQHQGIGRGGTPRSGAASSAALPPAACAAAAAHASPRAPGIIPDPRAPSPRAPPPAPPSASRSGASHAPSVSGPHPPPGAPPTPPPVSSTPVTAPSPISLLFSPSPAPRGGAEDLSPGIAGPWPPTMDAVIAMTDVHKIGSGSGAAGTPAGPRPPAGSRLGGQQQASQAPVAPSPAKSQLAPAPGSP